MDDIARAAFVISQALCAHAELEAMKAENQLRELLGDAPAYGEGAFLTIPAKYSLEHDQVLAYLQGTTGIGS